jgi:hypothetical protein
LVLSPDSRTTAGVLLLTIVAVQFGGVTLLGIVRGRRQMTDFQKTFWRAGHAHAGVLVVLGLVCQILADSTSLTGLLGFVARSGVPAAAIFMSAGFFVSSAHPGATQPNRLIALLWVGAACLFFGVVTLGAGLLFAPV